MIEISKEAQKALEMIGEVIVNARPDLNGTATDTYLIEGSIWTLFYMLCQHTESQQAISLGFTLPMRQDFEERGLDYDVLIEAVFASARNAMDKNS